MPAKNKIEVHLPSNAGESIRAALLALVPQDTRKSAHMKHSVEKITKKVLHDVEKALELEERKKLVHEAIMSTPMVDPVEPTIVTIRRMRREK